uniref:Fucosyltransferase n=1 Tax=Aegilops tauschii subsp. strangulata TaxID=200361 RepID=A0A453PNB3_AEGTS
TDGGGESAHAGRSAQGRGDRPGVRLRRDVGWRREDGAAGMACAGGRGVRGRAVGYPRQAGAVASARPRRPPPRRAALPGLRRLLVPFPVRVAVPLPPSVTVPPVCQYTVWTPFNGLGNRMLALASTFLHALLTDRVLLVHAPHEFDGLFCEPFPGSSWTLPAGFPIADFDGTFTMLSPTSYKNMKKAGTINGGENPNVTAETLPAYVFLDLIQSYTGAAFCEADQRVLAKFNWMVVKSDVYFATAFFLMPVYRRELARLFPEKEAAFHHLARYLFHPSNDVWAIVREFHEAYLAGADERIGLQVRVFPELPVPFETMYGQIMRCSEQEGLLPKVAERNAAAARNTSAVSSPDGRKTKLTSILVTSLSPEYYERIRGVYQANRAETGGYVAVHQPSHDGVQHTEARGHNQRALAEIYLLSFCDRIVTTAVSTFGYVAHGLAGVRPWVLLRSPSP